MNHRVLFVLCTFLVGGYALGQNTRSAVSIHGNDANPCTVPSPCRTFAKAITVTNSGGEIIALDSGGYGPFTIDRAVSVRPIPGAYAGLAPSSSDGIGVYAGVNDDVILRGITINGLGGSNLTGITFGSGRTLTIQNCSIDRMTGTGISDVSAGMLVVSDTTVTNSYTGVQVGNGNVGSPTVFATISGSRMDHNSFGVAVYQTGRATVTNTVLSHNSGTGLEVLSQVPTLAADVVIERSTLSDNTYGLYAAAGGGTATIRASNCTISHNTTGVSSNNAQLAPILSRQNNTLQGNATNGTFTATFSAD